GYGTRRCTGLEGNDCALAALPMARMATVAAAARNHVFMASSRSRCLCRSYPCLSHRRKRAISHYRMSTYDRRMLTILPGASSSATQDDREQDRHGTRETLMAAAETAQSWHEIVLNTLKRKA